MTRCAPAVRIRRRCRRMKRYNGWASSRERQSTRASTHPSPRWFAGGARSSFSKAGTLPAPEKTKPGGLRTPGWRVGRSGRHTPAATSLLSNFVVLAPYLTHPAAELLQTRWFAAAPILMHRAVKALHPPGASGPAHAPKSRSRNRFNLGPAAQDDTSITESPGDPERAEDDFRVGDGEGDAGRRRTRPARERFPPRRSLAVD